MDSAQITVLLLVAQRDHRVHTRGAARGDEAGEESHGGEQDRHSSHPEASYPSSALARTTQPGPQTPERTSTSAQVRAPAAECLLCLRPAPCGYRFVRAKISSGRLQLSWSATGPIASSSPVVGRIQVRTPNIPSNLVNPDVP